MSKRSVVLIIGGGFGGLQVARKLANAEADIILIDKHNYHLFQPLLYQVASAVLSPADIAQPIRGILSKQKNTSIILDEVINIDLRNSCVNTYSGRLSYDYLVVAAGATHSYFGNNEWQRYAPGLKTIDDAVLVRNQVLLAFESAELETDPVARKTKLTFVVIGGGPTGVELAGALKEIAMDSIPRDFRSIDTKSARIVLVEGDSRLLKSMSEVSSARALQDLIAMGIEVRLNSFVTKVDEHGIMLGDERLPASNVLWAAGVKASSLGEFLEVPLDNVGRVLVTKDLSLPDHENVFVIGDMASIACSKTGKPVPGVAQGAIQMGNFVAKIIFQELESIKSTERRPAFTYWDKGNLATIGKARAVADIMGMNFRGIFAWTIWSTIHILFLLSFRRKLFVILSWSWNYIFQTKNVRIITGNAKVSIKKPSDFL